MPGSAVTGALMRSAATVAAASEETFAIPVIEVSERTISRSVGAVKSPVRVVELLTVTVPAVLVANSFKLTTKLLKKISND